LICIAYQDLRYREVSWIFFPFLTMLGFLISSKSTTASQVLQNWIINLAFLLLQYLVATFFLNFLNSGRNKKIILGLGDILFLLSSAVFFSLSGFIVFYLLSLLFSLLIFMLIIKKYSAVNKDGTVPLAGLQSVFLIILFAFRIFA